MKKGIEVEGRFKGLPTIFMSAEEFLSESKETLLNCCREENVCHIYVSDHKNVLDLSEEKDEEEQEQALRIANPSQAVDKSFKYLSDNGIMTSVERTELLYETAGTINVLLLMPESVSNSFKYLKTHDQVKFHKENPFGGAKLEKQPYVFTATVETMCITLPHEFENDVEI
jgi:hypothetical protein